MGFLCFIFFVLPFLVILCVLVAVQSCMEWIPIFFKKMLCYKYELIRPSKVMVNLADLRIMWLYVAVYLKKLNLLQMLCYNQRVNCFTHNCLLIDLKIIKQHGFNIYIGTYKLYMWKVTVNSIIPLCRQNEKSCGSKRQKNYPVYIYRILKTAWLQHI